MSKPILPCADLPSLTTYAAGPPANAAAFLGNPFYINTTNSTFWVQYSTGAFAQVLTTA